MNRIIQGDCADIVADLPDGGIDLIYVDPPFFSGRRREDGKNAFDDRWPGGLEDYLVWLDARLSGMRRLLTKTGSLFVHLDWRAVHYVKVALDRSFGYGNLRGEIIWHYGSGGRARRYFPRKHDTILWYSRSRTWRFDPRGAEVPRNVCPLCQRARERWNHLRVHRDEDGRIYRTIRSAGRIYRYYDDEPTLVSDVWLDIPHLQQKDPERRGWPTQKPEALLQRVVASASAPGDLVADFFCGSGTTLAVAARLGRRYLGCDLEPEAVRIARERVAALEARAAASAAVGTASE